MTATILEELRDGWETAAQQDAMFNILTTPGKDQGRWNPAEFFAHGQVEVDEALGRLVRLGLDPAERGRALDFGCGVGRITQALAGYFADVDGVDISLEMISQAKRYASENGCGNCTYWRNERPDLALFNNDAFDLIYTVIVLQHMPRTLQEGYVREFVRVLKPGGIALFQIPEGPDYTHEHGWLSMYCTAPETVLGWVRDAGGEIVDIEATGHSGEFAGWRYAARSVS